ncbi:hypothetical protein Tsubulata_014659 [Turnera subulata]|uniref:Transport and Golgi organization protein 2 homolog n=1 Tax=Turnera subulata TaxID=218843 RepID=A0A9Q0JM46_9ROSI|nr:hypothetical protein Tsubulata_014659 [Turnera subulata]
MCIAAFVWQDHPFYPFLLLLNRDEYHSRATKAVGWWEDDDDDGDGEMEILGGRDEVAGGTWLACTPRRGGRIAFVTNVRELPQLPLAKSRGHLPVRFLQSTVKPLEFAKELENELDQYGAFNLIVADITSKSMLYITNRPKEGNSFVTEVSPGMHILSNASLDTPWPKAQRLAHSLKNLLDRCDGAELPITEMAEEIMTNTIKDDESKLPQIYPAKFEYQLSSIFVDTDSPLGRYGTRSTSVLSVNTRGEINFYERYLDKEEWRQHQMTSQIKDTNQTE